MSQPHLIFRNQMPSPFSDQADSGTIPAASAASAPSVSGLLLRAAECLTALLQSPTAKAGLNESRYNVLAALRRTASGTCSQTELATDLLQSESNLSTLLERMRQAGLISRVRSETDRRKASIGLTPAGREALVLADQARAGAAGPMFHALDERREAALGEALGLLVERLEHTLGVARHGTTRGDAVNVTGRPGSSRSCGIDERTGGPMHPRETAVNHGEPTT